MLVVPLTIHAPIDIAGQPVTVGVPFPRGALRDLATLRLADDIGKLVPLQTKPLARWSDGSVRWLLIDFILNEVAAGRHDWLLCVSEDNRTTPGSLLRMDL